MASRLVLHLGSMKSGTSHLQNVLGNNKERLAAQGVLFPGPRWRAQVAAVKELIGAGGQNQPPMSENGPWRRLVREIDEWDGPAVVSMEFLAPRPASKIEQIRADLGDTPVEAVLTCRDLARSVPAMWLEAVQTGGITPWPDFVEAVRRHRPEDRPARYFWRHQDIARIAARWAGVLGEERLTLVTVPPAGAPRDLLWRRFAEVIGVDPEGCDLEVRSNPSIGLASALVLLRLNQAYHREYGEMPPHYDEFVKHKLAKRGLVTRSADEPRLGLKARWVERAADDQIEALAAAPYRLVGDLEDLRAHPVPGISAEKVSEREIVDASIAAVIRSLEGWSEAERTLRRRRRRSGR